MSDVGGLRRPTRDLGAPAPFLDWCEAQDLAIDARREGTVAGRRLGFVVGLVVGLVLGVGVVLALLLRYAQP